MKNYGLIIALVCCSSFFSFTVGYSYGWSNMGGYYPTFPSFLSLDPTREEVLRYVEEAKEYIESCDRDIEMIQDARNDAANKVNNAIDSYNFSHY